VKCSKLQKRKKNIVIASFVFCLWKCSKLQKKKHCDCVFCVLFVEMLKAAKKKNIVIDD